MSMQIIANRKTWFTFSGTLIVLSLVALLVWGLKPGIDFTGGSLLEAKFKTLPTVAEINGVFQDLTLEPPALQTSGVDTLVLRFQSVNEEQHQEVLLKLREKFGEVSEVRFNSIGPSVGKELFQRALVAVILVTLMILGYIAWSFRKVSRPVPSWAFAVVVILTFLHDVIIPLGLFAYLGHFQGWEIGSPFIAAILTILGYSISDTIVVLDRVRENLRKMKGTFEEIVEASVHQTVTRSINTSVTTMLALAAILTFGGTSLHAFSLALLVGIFFGTYSSIFIAAPLLVTWYRWRGKR